MSSTPPLPLASLLLPSFYFFFNVLQKHNFKVEAERGRSPCRHSMDGLTAKRLIISRIGGRHFSCSRMEDPHPKARRENGGGEETWKGRRKTPVLLKQCHKTEQNKDSATITRLIQIHMEGFFFNFTKVTISNE